MRRGEIWSARLPLPAGRRPVLLVSRDAAYVARNKITIVEITTHARGIDSEVPLGKREGLPKKCCANADNIATVDKNVLEDRVGSLSADKIALLDRAIALSLGLTR